MADRQRDAAATRAAILAAARIRFATGGFASTTTRAVAADAGVDAALIARYFGSKRGLYDAALEVDLALPDFASVRRTQLGQRVAEEFFARWEGDDGRPLRALLAAAATDADAAAALRDVFAEQVRPAVDAATTDRSRERAVLVAATLMGVATGRYVLRLPGLADRSVDRLVALFGPQLQRHLTGRMPA